MTRLSALLIMFFLIRSSYAQYYYNDIVAVQQSNKQYQTLKANNIRSTTAQNAGSNNDPASSFTISQKISQDGNKITTTINNPSVSNSISISTYDGKNITSSKDSSSKVVTTTVYTYDPDGKIFSIVSNTTDAFMNSSMEEQHLWKYNTAGIPQEMLLIKDKKDTTQVQFSYDDQGNVGEERWMKRGRKIETYYYYYNEKKQLTDIVRFNLKVQKLLPDFMFEYNAKGNVSQMTQVVQGTSNYLVWKYSYNVQGLKVREQCYNKAKQLMGRVEYAYE